MAWKQLYYNINTNCVIKRMLCAWPLCYQFTDIMLLFFVYINTFVYIRSNLGLAQGTLLFAWICNLKLQMCVLYRECSMYIFNEIKRALAMAMVRLVAGSGLISIQTFICTHRITYQTRLNFVWIPFIRVVQCYCHILFWTLVYAMNRYNICMKCVAFAVFGPW